MNNADIKVAPFPPISQRKQSLSTIGQKITRQPRYSQNKNKINFKKKFIPPPSSIKQPDLMCRGNNFKSFFFSIEQP